MKSFHKIAGFFVLLVCFGNVFAQAESDKAIELYQQGEYGKAVESLQKAIEIDKKNQRLWLYLGMSLAKLKKDGKAANAFRKADKLSQKDFADIEKDVLITSKPRPSYTDSARMNQVQGTVAVAIEFGADGELKNAFAFQTLPEGLTENALKAAAKIKFEPATRDGKPIPTIKIIKYSFAVY